MKLSILLPALTLCQIQVGRVAGSLARGSSEQIGFASSHLLGLCLFPHLPLPLPPPARERVHLSRLAGGLPSRGSQGHSLLRVAAISRMRHNIYTLAMSTGGHPRGVGPAERYASSLTFKRILDGVRAISHMAAWPGP